MELTVVATTDMRLQPARRVMKVLGTCRVDSGAMSDFYQSAAWQRFQRELGARLISGEGDGWHYFARVQSDSFGNYVYAPGGPVARDASALRSALEHLTRESKAAGAYRAIVEPPLPIASGDMESLAARRIRGFRHARTQVIDLARPWEEVFGELNTSRRKQFRGAEKRGMTFEQSTDKADFDAFLELYRAQGDAGQFEVRDSRYFDVFYTALVQTGVAKMFVAKQHGKIEVIGITIDDTEASTRYYLYVGRDLGNNSLQISSPFITWMIRDAHERGFARFDLFGISESDDVEDETTGYTVFKRTFGGTTETFAGTWELAVSPIKYRAWRAALAAKRALRG